MLTRFVRIQLIVFSVVSVIGFAMLSSYLQVPTLLGIGKISVSLELPAAGGLYQFANVTYRGKQIGTVTSVRLTTTGAEALLSLDDHPRIPADPPRRCAVFRRSANSTWTSGLATHQLRF